MLTVDTQGMRRRVQLWTRRGWGGHAQRGYGKHQYREEKIDVMRKLLISSDERRMLR